MGNFLLLRSVQRYASGRKKFLRYVLKPLINDVGTDGSLYISAYLSHSESRIAGDSGNGDYGRERAVFEALDFRGNELCESLGYKDNGVALLGKLFELVRSALRIVLGKYGKPERRKAVNTVAVAHCGYFIHTVHASFHGLFLHSCR